ncbi:sugar ABC transporter ATP-binding protein [[Clostridium] hylemonae]|uniref:Sugar ABC transporter, ATP binding protein n=1 Tax=[Clostridium] hylemonae DSM 15053 TaxID=553973 RepID=C0C0J0_9FIRM|nr:sugar ABC transporter ATP-binding protein [[Clostridium] hylemonae]EEG74327.1 sugar ABC transporter, ATP binding protein [[Clostridium] hylemonae DSM 15053]
MGDMILEMNNIKKKFFDNVVLSGVDFSLKKGEIHALVGANGAGKSTLIKILNGIYSLDGGDISIEGKTVQIRQPSDAEKYGISFVHQELNVCLDLNVAENIFVGSLQKDKFGLYDAKKTIRKAQELIDDMKINISAKDTVRSLRAAEKQIIEILKAMTTNAKIMVLDEPTSSLTEKEKAVFFQLIYKLKENGVSIIFISHFLEDILQMTDRVTVLKDGHNNGVFQTAQVDKNILIEAMMGRSIVKRKETDVKRKETHTTALELKNFTSENKFKNISLTVKAGEIMGVCGLLGAGKSELARAVYGLDSYDSGELYLYGEEIRNPSPEKMMAKGTALITEDRKQEGFSQLLSIRETITLSNLGSFCNKAGVIKETGRKKFAEDMAKRMTVKCDSIEQRISELSGGNQQKVIIGRCVASMPRLFILDEPTRGVDVYAKMEIYNILTDMADQGVAILIFSSELEELIEVCDTITILKSGEVTGKVEPREISKNELFAMIS